MKRYVTALLFTGFLVSTAACADDRDVAVAMVEKGSVYLQKHGKDALIREVNNKSPEFVQPQTYLTVRATDGTQLAHPINPKIVGKNAIMLPDGEGKLFRKEIVDRANSEGKGWVDYSYNNPTTKQMEKKSTYFKKVGEVILEAGIYKGK